MIPASDLFITAMKKQLKQVYIKLEIYDSNMNYINEITQKVTRDSIGNISIDAERDIRRSFSFKLVNKDDEFTWNDDGLIFIDKRVKLYVGLKLPDGTIEYVPQGVFILTSPTTDHTSSGSYTEITGQDKAYLYTGNLGKFTYQTTLQANLSIREAIKLIAQDNGETLFNFDDEITEVVPYELTYEAGTNRWDALKELASLGKASISFDVNGYLRLRRIDLNTFQNQSSVWSFSTGDAFYAGNVRKLQDENLFNHVITLGGSSQTATVSNEIKVTENNPLWVGCRYSVEKIGERIYWHNDGNPDPLITTSDEALWRSKWLIMKYLGYVEGISLQISPLYLIEPDDIIEINDSVNSTSGRFLIKNLNIPLSPQLMNVECSKERILIDNWDFI